MAASSGKKDDSHRNLDRLATFVGFSDKTKLQEWMNSHLVKHLWDQYCEGYLNASRAAEGSIKRKIPKIDEVVTAIVNGEYNGKQKYSAVNPVTQDWDATDWQAWLLFHLAYHNTKNKNGLFYGRMMKDTDRYERLYQVVKRMFYIGVPKSRAEKLPEASHEGSSKSGEQDDGDARNGDQLSLMPINKRGVQIDVFWSASDTP